MSDPQYFKSIRNAISSFGYVFNQIEIIREQESNKLNTSREMVALYYVPNEQWFFRKQKSESYDEKAPSVEFEKKYPVMTYYTTGLSYAGDRQRNSVAQVRNNNSKTTSPAPYDLGITLSIYSKNQSDALMILEQILPMFQPQINLSIKEVSDLDVTNDCTLILNGADPDDNFSDGFDSNRIIKWDLSFTMRINIYPPYTQPKIIEKVIVDPVDVQFGLVGVDTDKSLDDISQAEIDRIMDSDNPERLTYV